ncbi:FAD-dependent oxidoreductase [Pendulispora rubella]|uniref:FAD-dependent oxidoreductase n=1 Tax=Pendulispora rubella TaxID=2741070 RepID=A0ABZ2LN41_9BACT
MSVVVVGAGLAGLTAAHQLMVRGIDVVVLEARDRVGGRMHGIEIAPGAWADAGAAYLGHRHTALHALMAEMGVAATPTTMHGDSRFALSPDRAPIRSVGRFPPLKAVALGEMFERLDEVTKSVRADAPWLSADAAKLDARTAADWIEEHVKHPDARLFFPLFLGEMMAADPADISVLHMAFYLRSGGGIPYLNAFEGGAQAERIAGGAHTLCMKLAERLGPRVHLGVPVRAIHQRSNGVSVYTSQSTVFEGHAVIVALPPRLAEGIDYAPALEAPRASPHTAPGCAVKVHLIYPTPLWREHGLSGWSVSADGPLLSTVDDSPADGRAGVLTGFVTGSEARRFGALSPDEQRDAVVAQARRLFPELPPPVACHVTDWVQAKYSRGCYAALFGPGDWMRLGPHLARPHGLVHWAGTETSTEFFGLMEGAIRSGHRAATEVSHVISPSRRSSR